MIGLIFLLALFTWVILCVHLARKAPKWLNIKRYRFTVSSIVFLSLLVAPAVQDIIGMRRFNQLCKERVVVWVSPDAYKVKRAKNTSPEAPTSLKGNWIPIDLNRIEYSDADTGKVFFYYQSLLTTGGYVSRVALLSGYKTCKPQNIYKIYDKLNIDNLLEKGKKHDLN